jgi:hypothetical protein
VTHALRLLALTTLLLLPRGAAAEVPIASEHRIPNRPPGCCGWCSLETLGRHLGIRPLFGITEKRASLSCPEDLTRALDELKVRYRSQSRGNCDTAILRDACRANLGATVGFRPLTRGGGGHIVTLVEFSADVVKVIDPNDPDGRVRTMSRERFLHWWDGFTVVLQPPAHAPARTTDVAAAP